MTEQPTRLLDALERTLPPDARASVRSILVVGAAGSAEAYTGLLRLFASAHLTSIDPDDVGVANLAPGPYDLALVRHPDIVANRAGWEATLRACAGHLEPGSVFVATTSLLPDAAFIDALIRAAGFEMLPGSPYTAIPVAIDGKDRYILMYVRG